MSTPKLHRYLRLSLTDKCNLRCTYCMPHGYVGAPSREFLTIDELLRLTRLLVREFHLDKVRITGGEPLTFPHLDTVIHDLAAEDAVSDLAMTTNAVGLAERAATLRNLGLVRINISLDSVNPRTFRRITQNGHLDAVLAGVRAAREAGFQPLKLNCVMMRGLTDDPSEFLPLIDFAREYEAELRFLELMPIGGEKLLPDSAFLSGAEMLRRLEQEYGPLEPVGRSAGGTSEEYLLCLDNRQTLRMGFITPVSQPFCVSCGRFRLTSRGRFISCLRSQRGTDLLPLVRDGATEEQLTAHLREFLHGPPHANRFEGAAPMIAIGG